MRLGTSAETNVSADVVSVSLTAHIDFKTNCDVSTNFSKIQKYELRFPSHHEQSEAPSGPVLRSHRVTAYTDRDVCVSNVRNAANFVISPRCCSTLHKKLIKKKLAELWRIISAFPDRSTVIAQVSVLRFTRPQRC